MNRIYNRSQINPQVREISGINEAIREFTMETTYGMLDKDKDTKIDSGRESSPINDVLNERGHNYGRFETHAKITQNLKDIVHNSPSWQNCSDSQKETLEMILHKIGRIVNGDPNYKDSWVDIIGYTQLVIEQLDD